MRYRTSNPSVKCGRFEAIVCAVDRLVRHPALSATLGVATGGVPRLNVEKIADDFKSRLARLGI